MIVLLPLVRDSDIVLCMPTGEFRIGDRPPGEVTLPASLL